MTISFVTAEGLEPGKTKLRYRNLDIGAVKAIRLSNDHARVLVDAQLTDTARQFAVEDTRFWVVRPRVGSSGISGLETMLSGAYIGVDGFDGPIATLTMDVDPAGGLMPGTN